MFISRFKPIKLSDLDLNYKQIFIIGFRSIKRKNVYIWIKVYKTKKCLSLDLTL